MSLNCTDKDFTFSHNNSIIPYSVHGRKTLFVCICSNDLNNICILLKNKWLNKNMYILTSEKSNYDSQKTSRNL